jgi:hypothetical protein
MQVSLQPENVVDVVRTIRPEPALSALSLGVRVREGVV